MNNLIAYLIGILAIVGFILWIWVYDIMMWKLTGERPSDNDEHWVFGAILFPLIVLVMFAIPFGIGKVFVEHFR